MLKIIHSCEATPLLVLVLAALKGSFQLAHLTDSKGSRNDALASFGKQDTRVGTADDSAVHRAKRPAPEAEDIEQLFRQKNVLTAHFTLVDPVHFFGHGSYGAVVKVRLRQPTPQVPTSLAMKITKGLTSMKEAAIMHHIYNESVQEGKGMQVFWPRVYHHGQFTDAHGNEWSYVAMSIAGPTVNWLAATGKTTAQQLKRIVFQAYEAMKFLHHLGYTHNDLHLKNMVVDARYRVVPTQLQLIDFGNTVRNLAFAHRDYCIGIVYGLMVHGVQVFEEAFSPFADLAKVATKLAMCPYVHKNTTHERMEPFEPINKQEFQQIVVQFEDLLVKWLGRSFGERNRGLSLTDWSISEGWPWIDV